MLWTDEQVLRAIQTPPPAAAVPDGATYEARLQEARALYTRGKMKSDAWFEAYRAYRQAMRYNDLKFSDPGDSYDYQVILDEVARQVLADYQEAAQAFNRRSYKPAGALLRKINRYAGGATPLFGKEFRDHIDKLESYSAIDLKKYGDRVDPGAPVLLTRIRVLELMNKAEAAWQTGDATLALSTFEKMQEGGTDERPEGTTSRTFADAGAAKCKVRLAINQKRYGDAAADLEGFKKLAATLDADKKFPPEGLHLAQRLQSEVAHELHTELELRKRMADAPVLENERR